MDMFMLTTVAYIGIVMEILTQLLILGVGIAVIKLLLAKSRQLKAEAINDEYYLSDIKEEK